LDPRAARYRSLTAARGCGRRARALLALRRVAELLSADRGLVHGAALDDSEDGHPLEVLAARPGVLLAAAGAGAGARGSGARVRPRGDGHGARVGAELEAAAREFIERPLVLEKDDLAVGLAAQLQPDAQLVHRGIADVLALFVDATLAVRRADRDAALADRG